MNKLPVPRPSRRSYTKHRQDVLRQIILPVVLVAVIVIAVAVLLASATLQGSGDVATWAAIATIGLVIPIMLLMLIIMILAGTVVWLLAKLLGVSPRYTGIAQEYALWFNAQVMLWTDRIIQPIVRFKAWLSLFSKQE